MLPHERVGFFIDVLEQGKGFICHSFEPSDKRRHRLGIMYRIATLSTGAMNQPVSFGENFLKAAFHFGRDETSLSNFVERCSECLSLCFLDKGISLSKAHTLFSLNEQNEILSGDTFQFLKLPQGKANILSNHSQAIGPLQLLGKSSHAL